MYEAVPAYPLLRSEAPEFVFVGKSSDEVEVYTAMSKRLYEVTSSMVVNAVYENEAIKQEH